MTGARNSRLVEAPGRERRAGSTPAAAALANSLFELLNDENPTRIEYLWQKMFRAHRDLRGGPFMVPRLDSKWP